MPLRDRRLVVLCQSKVAGTLSMDDDGLVSFSYDDSYDGPDLSVIMPRGMTTQGSRVTAWFDGLLPDSIDIRRGMADKAGHGYGANSTFGLLSDYGLDLPGAVQVVTEDAIGSALGRNARYVPISKYAIGQRLHDMERRSHGTRPWLSGRERWSLAGNQGKIALMCRSGRYYSCEGSAASNVIVKPGIAGMRDEALNECLCMRLASEVGIPTAKVRMDTFGDVNAIVIDRYDRMQIDGNVMRLHQEDVCQSFGMPPSKKYAEDGGLSAQTIMRSRMTDEGSRTRFYDALIYNYLIGATDGHAKNYSLMHDVGSGFFLAPLYDIASIIPYAEGEHEYKVAMGIGGDARIGRLRGSTIRRFARHVGMDATAVIDRSIKLANDVRESVEHVVSEMGEYEGIDELACSLVPNIRLLCDAFERNADATGRKMFVPHMIGMTRRHSGNDKKSCHDGLVWIDSYMRNGKPVKGHWRRVTRHAR